MPVQPNDRVIFESVFEGLFHRALQDQMTPALEKRLKDEAKVDVKALEPAYPAEAWLKTVTIVAQELHPGAPLPLALEQVGETVARGFFQTLIGKALIGVLTLIGPRRTLARTERNLRNGNNYTETSLVERAPNHFELTVNEPSELRHVLTGIVSGGIARAGAKNAKVAIVRTDATTTTYDVRWD